MDRLAKIDKDDLVRQMRAEFEATMERVANPRKTKKLRD